WKGKQAAASAAAPATVSPARVKPVTVKTVPSFVEPQLAKLVERPPAHAGWVHEVKFDGYRVQLHVSKHAAVLRTRTGLDWTDRFSALANLAKALPDCVIDGEVVALDRKQLPSF